MAVCLLGPRCACIEFDGPALGPHIQNCFTTERLFAFAMRSSPILCAYDAITFLLCLLWHAISLRSPHAAKRHVARSRFRNDPKDQGSSLYKLQYNFIFQAATFVLGAVPQIVKLYAMQGLMWTQIWGSVYFGFFVILQALVFPEDASIQQDTPSAAV